MRHRRHSLAMILLFIVSGLLIAAIAGWAIIEEEPAWLIVEGVYKAKPMFFLGAIGVAVLIGSGLVFGLSVRNRIH